MGSNAPTTQLSVSPAPVFEMHVFPIPHGNKDAFRNPLGDGFYQFGDNRRSTPGFYFPDGWEAAYLAVMNAAALAWDKEPIERVEYPVAPDVPWWIVLDNGVAFHTVGCYQRGKEIYVTNLNDPYNPVVLKLEDCGKKWFPVLASTRRQAKENARKQENLAYCRRVRNKLIPADRALRREVR